MPEVQAPRDRVALRWHAHDALGLPRLRRIWSPGTERAGAGSRTREAAVMRNRLIAGVGVVLSAYAGVTAIRLEMPELLGLAALCFVVSIFAAAMEQLLHEGVEEGGQGDEGHGSQFSVGEPLNATQQIRGLM